MNTQEIKSKYPLMEDFRNFCTTSKNYLFTVYGMKEYHEKTDQYLSVNHNDVIFHLINPHQEMFNNPAKEIYIFKKVNK